jgi:Flp pilus assembly protein TadB
MVLFGWGVRTLWNADSVGWWGIFGFLAFLSAIPVYFLLAFTLETALEEASSPFSFERFWKSLKPQYCRVAVQCGKGALFVLLAAFVAGVACLSAVLLVTHPLLTLAALATLVVAVAFFLYRRTNSKKRNDAA